MHGTGTPLVGSADGTGLVTNPKKKSVPLYFYANKNRSVQTDAAPARREKNDDSPPILLIHVHSYRPCYQECPLDFGSRTKVLNQYTGNIIRGALVELFLQSASFAYRIPK